MERRKERIANEILMYLRSSRNIRQEVYLQDPVGVDKEGNEVTLMDLLGSDGDEIMELVANSEEERRLLKKLQVLDEKERYVICSRYGLGNTMQHTQREIAKTLGISRSYVSRIEKKAVQKLAKEIQEK